MRIITPTDIERVAWEGRLEPLGEVFKGTGDLPRASLGEPAWWPAEQAMEHETGRKWTPPVDGRRYTLVRLACTLHPPAGTRTHYARARLTAYLRPRHGSAPVVAHDLYPQRLTAESKGKFTFGLGPKLKFAQVVDLELAELGAEIEYRQTFPIIQGFGLGEGRPYWQFARHAGHPLLGCQSVYLVIAAPAGATGARLSLELTAELETRYGPLRVGSPQVAAPDHLSWTIGG